MSVHIIGSRPARKVNMELEKNVLYIGFTGLSTDTKPTSVVDGEKTFNVCNGSYFLEADTGKVSYYNSDAGTWSEGV